MAHYVKRRVASIQLGFAAGALGLLAGIGLGKGTEPPPQVDAELAAKKTITITGSNIVDGSVKYQDLSKASIQKGLYLKAQVDRLFLKLSDADVRFNKVITNALGGYIKLGDADTRFLKLDALNGFLKLSDADARFIKHGALDSYVKLETADGRFLKLDALSGYLKLDAADARFAKVEDLGAYLKLDQADARIDKHLTDNGYIKLGALDNYVKVDALSGYVKLDALADYVKAETARSLFVEGDGSVLTGSQLVGAEKEKLFAVPDALGVEAAVDDEGKGADLTLTNLSGKPLHFSSSGGERGTLDQGSTTSILIGLLLPAVVQVTPAGDGGAVHTLSFTAFEAAAGQVQVAGQALSGAPPAR